MLHKLASTLRWRLKPVRWAGKALRTLADLPHAIKARANYVQGTTLAHEIRSNGFIKLGAPLRLPHIDYSAHAGSCGKAPFVDISAHHSADVTEAFVALMEDSQISEMVMDYFDGSPWLWNVALNYSDPSTGLNDSQLWHFDYGDSRQLHFMVYFGDVPIEAGPFTFLPAEQSDRVRRHPILIERLTDDDLRQDYAIDAKISTVRLTGQMGDVFANDPGRLLHQGARCSIPRLVMFVSFTSRTPMSSGGGLVISKALRNVYGAAYRARCPEGPLCAAAFG